MIRNSSFEECSAKQEGRSRDHDKVPRNMRSWTAMSNPRIVRVSRAFGGKDRHSKVTTVRGLRDRRVRLSVPTAIQLYDLQDKLGLNQPSKVVDWLLNAARNEIDKLPPLQMVPGNFIEFPQMSTTPQASSLHCVGDDCNSADDMRAQQFDFTSMFWNPAANKRMRSNDTTKEPSSSIGQGSNIAGNEAGNGISFASYNALDPSNAYISYAGGHSSKAQAFHPIPMFESNFDSKVQYSYFDITRGFMNASQEDLALRHQQNHEE